MKKNLGRFFLVFFALLYSESIASTYEWSATANKSKAVTNEAIHLSYVCKFSDRAELYAIDFNPMIENDKYSIKLLSESTNIVDNKKINYYEFVAFVKKPGVTIFDFEATMKKTTQESIENTVIGRDNVENEEFSTNKVSLKPLSIEVRESKSQLVGKFTFDVKKDKADIKAYEPYHMRITISGMGSFESIKAIEFDIENVKIFSSEPVKDMKLTKDGFSGSWSQDFAFVSSEDFIVPEIKIEYFDIHENTIKEFLIPLSDVKVSKAFTKEELLDEVEEGYEFNFDYVYYLLTFIAGFLAAKIKFKAKMHKEKKNPFKEKIISAKSLDDILMILVLEDRSKYKDMIESIEMNKSTSIKDVKKELLN